MKNKNWKTKTEQQFYLSKGSDKRCVFQSECGDPADRTDERDQGNKTRLAPQTKNPVDLPWLPHSEVNAEQERLKPGGEGYRCGGFKVFIPSNQWQWGATIKNHLETKEKPAGQTD